MVKMLAKFDVSCLVSWWPGKGSQKVHTEEKSGNKKRAVPSCLICFLRLYYYPFQCWHSSKDTFLSLHGCSGSLQDRRWWEEHGYRCGYRDALITFGGVERPSSPGWLGEGSRCGFTKGPFTLLFLSQFKGGFCLAGGHLKPKNSGQVDF